MPIGTESKTYHMPEAGPPETARQRDSPKKAGRSGGAEPRPRSVGEQWAPTRGTQSSASSFQGSSCGTCAVLDQTILRANPALMPTRQWGGPPGPSRSPPPINVPIQGGCESNADHCTQQGATKKPSLGHLTPQAPGWARLCIHAPWAPITRQVFQQPKRVLTRGRVPAKPSRAKGSPTDHTLQSFLPASRDERESTPCQDPGVTWEE